jgi:hypothetical protein
MPFNRSLRLVRGSGTPPLNIRFKHFTGEWVIVPKYACAIRLGRREGSGVRKREVSEPGETAMHIIKLVNLLQQ